MTQGQSKPLDDDAAFALRRRVKIARYIEILAHVLHFGPGRTYDVVQRFGLTLETWLAVDEAWVAELADSIRKQQAERAMEFTAHFSELRKRLTRDQPTIEAIGSPDPNNLQSRAGHPSSLLGAPAPLTPLAPPTGASLPSAFLPPTTSQSGGSRDDGRSPWAAGGAQAAPPPIAYTPPPAPPVAPPVQEKAPAVILQALPSKLGHAGTHDISAFVPRQPLPFEAGAAPPSVSQPAPAAAKEADVPKRARVHPGEGTKDISSYVPRHLLPFDSSSGPASSPQPATQAAKETGAPAPSAAPPGKRLVRFDPQTGQPYPTPIWVDIEPDPKK